MKKKKGKIKQNRIFLMTFGAIFLISALIVALIPVQKNEAGLNTPTVTLSATESKIPIIQDSDEIYSTGDGKFQFAYVQKGSGGDKIAVILGYDSERELEDGKLVIPDTVDAYVKVTHADGTPGGYAAVGKSGNVLYYPVVTRTPKTDSNGDPLLDAEGNPLFDETTEYMPCIYDSHSQWYYLEDGITVRNQKDFYYYDTATSSYLKTDNESHQRIQNATVAYISSQHVKLNGDKWVLVNDPENPTGIFSNARNITNLVTGSQLLGIGDYAFFSCTSLQGIELGNGANTIGNYAFANCINLKYCKIPISSATTAIGDHTFYECRSLEEFEVPIGVEKIGDSAFENCISLSSIELCGNGQEVILNKLGDSVFAGCEKLDFIQFPRSFSQDIALSWLKGCSALRYISIPNTSMKLIDDGTGFSFEQLKNMLSKEFYLEGASTSNIHDVATTNSIAFKYLDEDLYEKVVNVSGSDGSGKLIYRVDSNNTLQYFYMDASVKAVNLPSSIGPYKIISIGSDSFQGNHTITKLTVPSSITSIGDYAFLGCHNLKDVIFESPIQLKSIGKDAFDTQVANMTTHGTCSFEEKPVLTFTGEVNPDSLPFSYAMNPANNFNNENQYVSYITFYSGWPSIQTIQYDPDSDQNVLIDFPTLTEIRTLTNQSYPFLTDDQISAANTAESRFLNGEELTQNEAEIINAAINPVLNNGIEAVSDGLFSGKKADGTTTGTGPDLELQTITILGMKVLSPYTFSGCSSLIAAFIGDSVETIGDKAFENCNSLKKVNALTALKELGSVPFYGCDSLEDLTFGVNSGYLCKNAIIYHNNSNGGQEITEVLSSRGNSGTSGSLLADELVGVSSIADGAFSKAYGVSSVDLTKSSIQTIPEDCFRDTSLLTTVKLPLGAKVIKQNAFTNSRINYLELPSSISNIDSTAFTNDAQTIYFYCEEGTVAEDFANAYTNITVVNKPITYKVTFYDEDGITVLDTIEVEKGGKAVSEVIPSKEGYTFIEWIPSTTVVTSDMSTFAKYELIDSEDKKVTVTFIDFNDSIIEKKRVSLGSDCDLPKDPIRPGYTFTGWRPSVTNVQGDMTTYAQYELIDSSTKKFTLRFLDYNDNIISTQSVLSASEIILPKDPVREGYRFTGWRPDIAKATADMTTYAQYELIDSSNMKFTVRFIDYDDKELSVQSVLKASDIVMPSNPVREGYTFTGWRPDVSDVTKDTVTYAQYELIDSEQKKFVVTFCDYDDKELYKQNVISGKDAILPQNPTRAGYTFLGWKPNITNITADLTTYAQYEKITETSNPSSGGQTGTGTDQTTGTGTTLYTVTVKDGDGSGSYVSGANVIVVANNPATGKVFDKWSSDSTDVTFTSTSIAATVFKMPAHNTTITANYKDSGASGTSSSGTGTNASGTTTGLSTATKASNGTKVDVSKTGISNTSKATASVSGSTDSYIVKITDSSETRDEVENALKDKYGDIDTIKYFAMDISLYDSKGNKVTDTSNIKVTITLPIPDDLVDYGGNSKVAYVLNGKLVFLNPKFNKIDNVYCVTFVMDHFSPYTIYVDTSDLNASKIMDTTPKTGDPIHPKWFLCIAFIGLSLVCFTLSDKRFLGSAKLVSK